MNRRSFLRLFGLGAAAGAVAKLAKPQRDWWRGGPPPETIARVVIKPSHDARPLPQMQCRGLWVRNAKLAEDGTGARVGTAQWFGYDKHGRHIPFGPIRTFRQDRHGLISVGEQT